MTTVYVRYKNAFARTDAEDVGMYLTELLRGNPNCRFFLIITENRMFAVGSVKDEKSERWKLRDFRFLRDDDFRPNFLYFTPDRFFTGEMFLKMYGGIAGLVSRQKPSAPLFFYLLGEDLALTEEEAKAGATKEAVWEVFRVENKDGTATIRPLLSDPHTMMVVATRTFSTYELQNLLSDYALLLLMTR
jgi:hypothetical protein